MSRRRTASKPPVSSRGLPTWVIVTGIGVVVVLAAIGLFLLQTPAPAPLNSNSSGATITAGRTLGNPSAKVELVDWSDFQ